jgi:hypothetical protein
MILVAGAALALSACGGGNSTEANQANAMGADNMMLDQNMMMDGNASMGDMNAMGNMGGDMGMNGAANSTTQNMMRQDAQTNDPDTNLANGL